MAKRERLTGHAHLTRHGLGGEQSPTASAATTKHYPAPPSAT
ncbi:hypothetical protein I551_3104 [Mycobacterium ulcerans str. Harvey]|uniref:Uncharacterized protein n=1 Tax=Mycobacterium ulcerans str. Harvey TaxID=1299332 RepID=A0ABN0R0M5_MYCUL|nr:hypothetical protein I551_3104 [Mycobacterium ulcerans str. Harvey]